jgi:hypothetical protein
MNMDVRTRDGGMMIGTNRQDAEAAGLTNEAIIEAEALMVAAENREQIRANINRDAGDMLSLLGTASDATSIAVLVGACFMAALEETSYAAFRTTALASMQSISGDQDPVDITKGFLASVVSGDIRLPALEKGIVAVLAEVQTRGNAVAEVLNPADGGAG